MKIAAYNVENLFDRAKAFNEEKSVSTPVLKGTSELNNIFEKEVYDSDDIKQIKKLIDDLGLKKSDQGPFVLLRQIRGNLLKRPKNKPIEVVAKGRDDWIGWVELRTEHVNETAILNTGRVIKDVNADVLAVIEAENRVTLKMFSDSVLDVLDAPPYEQVMVIDGNDTRGIDVGIMTTRGYHIDLMRSHIHDVGDNKRTIFSRDCPEFRIKAPNGRVIWVLPNHFKSKFGGNNAASKARRKAQSKRVAEIYQQLIKSGNKNVVVLGDLNDTPDSDELKPLLKNTDLKDVSEHTSFDTGEFEGIGTFGNGSARNKIDYLLLSPSLFSRVQKSGLFRMGAWSGKVKKKWTMYDTIKTETHVASDHHLIWADIGGC